MKTVLLLAISTSFLSFTGSTAFASVPSENQALFLSYGTYGSAEHRDLFRVLERNSYNLTILSPNFPERAAPIVPNGEMFLEALSKYADRAQHPELKTLLVFLDLHGESRRKEEATHPVLFGEERFSLDRIRPVLRSITKRGVDIGIVSFACYAGSAIRLADDDDRVCAITSSDESTPTLPWVMNEYARSFADGGSLTEIFRRVRARYFYPTLPRISTEIGKTIADETTGFEEALRSPPRTAESREEWLRKQDRLNAEEKALAAIGLEDQVRATVTPLVIVPESAKAVRFVGAERAYYERRYSELTVSAKNVASDACDRIRIRAF